MASTSAIDVSDFAADALEFRAASDEFVVREVVGHLDSWRATRATSRELFDRAGDLGLLGSVVPVERGGAGLSDRRYADLVVESLAAVGAVGTALAVGFHCAVAVPALLAYRSPQADELIASAAVGEIVIAIANLDGSIQVDSIDGERMVLVGTSAAVVNAAVADYFMLLVDDPFSDPLLLLVAAAEVGIAPSSALLGMPESGSRDVSFDALRVTDDMVVGRVADRSAWFADVATVVAATCIEATRVAVRQTVVYARERKVFGTPLAEFDNTRGVVSGLHAEVTLISMSYQECGFARESGTANDVMFAALATRSATLYDRAVDQCLQLHGGYGYMREYPIAHAFAAARQVLLLVELLPLVHRTLETDVGLRDE